MRSSGMSFFSSGVLGLALVSSRLVGGRRSKERNENFKNKSSKQEPPNSKPESAALSKLTGTEIALPPSASDLVEELLSSGRDAINKRVEHIEWTKLQQLIRNHYNDLARKTMVQIWNECGSRTGHTKTTDERGFVVCETCSMPFGINAEERKMKGIAQIAVQLRTADQNNGMEYIPGKNDEQRERAVSLFRRIVELDGSGKPGGLSFGKDQSDIS